MNGPIRRPQPGGAQVPGRVDGYVLPSGRYILRKERRRLPNGRVVEMVSMVDTSLNGEYATTVHVLEYPETDDGIAPRSIRDIHSCSNPRCRRTVTGRHCGCCRSCGLDYCSACLTSRAVHRRTVLMCRECATPWLLKLIKKMFRKIFSRGS